MSRFLILGVVVTVLALFGLGMAASLSAAGSATAPCSDCCAACELCDCTSCEECVCCEFGEAPCCESGEAACCTLGAACCLTE